MQKKIKVLIGSFTAESNEHVPTKCESRNFDYGFGEECIDKMEIRDIFEAEDIELIPTIYADSGANGIITYETFAYIESTFFRIVKEHLREIDGIYLHLHGASEVENLGSGEQHLLKKLRSITGKYLPIMVTCDPHGNLTEEYVQSTTLIRSYRESPHTDARETKRHVAQLLCNFLKNRRDIHSIYRKLPLILGGEQSVSTDEPVLSINRYLDELEKDERILSASWHVGYLRHDTACAGCGIVVVPASEKDIDYANGQADRLAEYVWEKRHEFHYTGLTAQPQEALEMALRFEGSPAFITDSGDNVTSGATGWNTYILRQVLGVRELKKKVLFASICDPITFEELNKRKEGEQIHISLGMNYDELSRSVELDVVVKARGPITGFMYRDHTKAFGQSVTVSVVGKPVDIMVASTRQPVVEIHQFDDANLCIEEYDLIVVKQGYIFWQLKEKAKFYVMSLTDGATLQDTKVIPFKRIRRPMFPIDDI